MIRKVRSKKIEGLNNAFWEEEQYEDEPISKNICSSIDDFYNLMHLIKKSWINRKYHLRMKEAGYTIYDENKTKAAWIGIKEKYKSLMFIIFSDCSSLYENAQKISKGPMTVFDFDEDLWVYSELKIIDILKGESFEKQKEIVQGWINDTIIKIL
jgi:hypothetical protein